MKRPRDGLFFYATKMKYNIFSFLLALFIFINSFECLSIDVHATHGSSDGFHTWTTQQKYEYYITHLSELYSACVGFLYPHDKTQFIDSSLRYKWDEMNVDSMTYEEWIASRLGYDEEEKKFVVDNELSDLMYRSANYYIEEHCGWYEWNTFIPSDLTKKFTNKCQYDYVAELVKGLKDNEVLICIPDHSSHTICGIVQYDGFVRYKSSADYKRKGYIYYNWEKIKQIDVVSMSSSGIENGCGFETWANVWGHFFETEEFDNPNLFYITAKRETHRVYKTVEDYKAYSVGSRPYYCTTKFTDYNESNDNSCTISESELNGSSVYGDVVNNVITIYEDADGLTEDQLRAILDEYFKNKDSGGSDSGSDGGGSGGGSGGGLSDFLKGLGKIGDAIMSILGKLLEYVAKAVELLSDTILNVIEVIPQNITALLSGLFPFFPKEWLVAIELSLVLAVILGIVGLFKK